MRVELPLLREAARRFLAFSPGPEREVRVFFAPGRVNVIGEHIDYNGGRVFPAALSLGNWLFARPRAGRSARFASTVFPGEFTVDLDRLLFDPADGFANYPKGVMWALHPLGARAAGGDFLFAGNLPGGAGLSSSASVELAAAVAVNALCGAELPMLELVKACQRAENQFVGVNSGIMDQFASGMGRAEHAVLLDTATLAYEYVPLVLGEHRLVVANTNAPRGLADSRYNERRGECERALAALRRARPGLAHLAELAPSEFAAAAAACAWDDPALVRRARHVVEENARVSRAVAALRAGRLAELGGLLNASHRSLRDDYEVTGPHLDALAEAAWAVPGCLGSRMTGAGFGGCTVSLVRADGTDAFAARVQAAYRRATGLAASFYVSEIGDGAREVTEEAADTWRF